MSQVHLGGCDQKSKQSLDIVVIAIWWLSLYQRGLSRTSSTICYIVFRSLGNFSGEKLIVNLVALWLEETAVAQYSITDVGKIQQHKNRYWIEDP